MQEKDMWQRHCQLIACHLTHRLLVHADTGTQLPPAKIPPKNPDSSPPVPSTSHPTPQQTLYGAENDRHNGVVGEDDREAEGQ